MNINSDIAKTYIFSNKKLTAVAALGVLLGMSIYIFMNCMLVSFNRIGNDAIFKVTSHIRVYNDDVISQNLVADDGFKYLISNPKVVPKINTIINPKGIEELILHQKDVTIVTPQVNTSVFYNNGKSQISGICVGINPEAADLMYNIKSSLVDGDFDQLKTNPNGIFIGSGVAEKMNLTLSDNINLTSQKGVSKTLKVVGIFKTNNYQIDKTKSYINIGTAQQLLNEGSSYITDINVNINDPEKVEEVVKRLSEITGYKAESWKESNETIVAANKMRKIVITCVSSTLLLVAGFGIYNILNMTVSQKINDIAILKAMGFKGKDVIRIFVTQALTIGIMGVIGGMLMATLLITILKKVYVGGDIGYFPVNYEPQKFLQGAVIGLIITFFAGYFPAKKAAQVDPVSIFRK
jgi:lipoprotein-releasing system permease protein